jgi:hypothetical protein
MGVIIEKGLQGHAGSAKHGSTAKNIGVFDESAVAALQEAKHLLLASLLISG